MATQTMSEMKARILAKAAEDGDFRARLLDDSKAVISAELGISIPEGFTIQVYEDDTTTAHFVLPLSDHLTEEELAQAAGGHKGHWADTAHRH